MSAYTSPLWADYWEGVNKLHELTKEIIKSEPKEKIEFDLPNKCIKVDGVLYHLTEHSWLELAPACKTVCLNGVTYDLVEQKEPPTESNDVFDTERINKQLIVATEMRELLIEYHSLVHKNTDLKVLANCFDTDNDGNCTMCIKDKHLCPKRFVDIFLEKKTFDNLTKQS